MIMAINPFDDDTDYYESICSMPFIGSGLMNVYIRQHYISIYRSEMGQNVLEDIAIHYKSIKLWIVES